MYSAIAKLFRAFFESLLVCFATAIVFACLVACVVTVFEYLHGFNLLPIVLEKLYVSLGGV